MLRCLWRTNSKAENRSDLGKNDSRSRDDKKENRLEFVRNCACWPIGLVRARRAQEAILGH